MTPEELKEMMRGVAQEQLSGLRGQRGGAAQMVEGDKPKVEGGGAARLIRALAGGKGDPDRAAKFARKSWEDESLARALETGTDESGGFIVPPEYSTEIIELLYPRTAVRSLGARTVPMENGTLEIPKLAGGVQAGYVGENSNIGTDEPEFGQLNLSWKKLACIVPISNDLIRFSNPNADRVVRDDLVSSMALREDLAFLRDDGSEQKPTGMRYIVPDSNLLWSEGDSLDDVTNDLSRMELALEENNTRMISPGWIFSPRTKQFLMRLRDGNGNYVYRDEMRDGNLNGYPFRVTTQIPNDLSNEADDAEDNSEVYLADFADAVIGEASDLIISVSQEAAYHDGSDLQAAFSRDQTLIRAIARHDFGMRHENSLCVLRTAWGA